MSSAVGTVHPRGRLSPRGYWALRRFSWVLQLVGMAAGGWFFLRATLVWGLGGYPLTADLFVAGAALVLWAVGAVLLLRPPAGAVASIPLPIGEGRAVVWQLGRRFRGWNLLATPVAGVVALFAPPAVATIFGLDPGVEPAPLWLGLLLGVFLVTMSFALVWLIVRAGLLGVELTETELVVRGYVRTRRIPREEVVGARPDELGPLAEFLSTWAMNRRVDSAITLALRDGSRRSLPVAHSGYPDLAEGAAIIRVWCGAMTVAEAMSVGPRWAGRRARPETDEPPVDRSTRALPFLVVS